MYQDQSLVKALTMSSSCSSSSSNSSAAGSSSSSPVPGNLSPNSILPIEIQNGAQKVTFFQPEHQCLHQQNLAQMETLAQQMNRMSFQHPQNPHSTMQSPNIADNGLFCQSERSRDPVYASMASHYVTSSNYQNTDSIDTDMMHFPDRQISTFKSPDFLPRCNLHWI